MKYVAYYRLSKKDDDRPSLGLDAQRDTVLSYIRHNGNQIIAEFTEIESGKNNNRPELLRAIYLTKQEDATLVIAKLDRLSRNVHFISALMESKVKFICCDMPDASPLTIHIFAALAQWERERISERTKEALAQKRRNEPNYRHGHQANGTDNFGVEGRRLGVINAHKAIAQKARSREIRNLYHIIKPKREQGMSYYAIAKWLNAEDYRTNTGKVFQGIQVKNIYERFSKEE